MQKRFIVARKKRVQKQKMDKDRLLDDIKTAKVGDYCYFLDNVSS